MAIGVVSARFEHYWVQMGLSYKNERQMAPLRGIRLILSLALLSGWFIKQLDVHNAFLNGNLFETMYMKQPPGYIDAHHPDHTSKTDVSLFYHSQGSDCVYLWIYVDDILMKGNNQDIITQLIAKLSDVFKIRDLGEPGFFLGIVEIKCRDGILLSQQRYMHDILKRDGMAECKPLSTPFSSSKIVSTDTDLYDDATQYRSLVGALQYLTITRLDLSFAVNQLCQHMHAHTITHWEHIKRVLRYVKGTVNFGLRVRQSTSREIHAFSDSD
ncbi:PREDICTED: uncharacterized protein LOC109154414 [Ipomoea nil]|uniref:uncharacterized protein LOC109154414 n=1 Tax=Ipomoea nil TaxID=35883 RepID=UPI0009014254|nr:PREDICTED: uncharacterized protein LOC109154414 [Ipomoea nil]